MTIINPESHYGTVTIVGVGLIGASLGLALKQAGVVQTVLGVGRSQANLDQAIKMGAIDGIVDLVEASKKSDVIVLCVPVAQMRAAFETIEPHLEAKTLITDAGSTKGDVVQAARAALHGRAGVQELRGLAPQARRERGTARRHAPRRDLAPPDLRARAEARGARAQRARAAHRTRPPERDRAAHRARSQNRRADPGLQYSARHAVSLICREPGFQPLRSHSPGQTKRRQLYD